MEYSSKAADVFHPERRPPLFLQAGLRWNEAAICAELSRLAYFHFEQNPEQAVEVANACKAVGLEFPLFFDDPGTQTQAFAVLRPAERHAYVAFRGTQPDQLLDCLSDADVALDPWQGSQRAHRGFMRAYRPPLIKSAIQQQLRQWASDYPGLRITFTGHSLGAALATLAAADTEGAALVNFGSPRVGDADFAQAFSGRTVSRYVDCCDVVTEVPLHLPLLFPYQHLDGRHYIDSQRKVWSTPADADVEQDRRRAGFDPRQLPELFDTIRAAARDPDQAEVPRFLSDHAIINYITPLLAL